MTRRLLATAIAALLLPTALAAAPARATAAEAAPADARVAIPVGGMTCDGCVNTITGKLQKVAGVKAVKVNLEKKRASITYDAAQVTPKALVEAIRDAGYEPGVPAVE